MSRPKAEKSISGQVTYLIKKYAKDVPYPENYKKISEVTGIAADRILQIFISGTATKQEKDLLMM